MNCYNKWIWNLNLVQYSMVTIKKLRKTWEVCYLSKVLILCAYVSGPLTTWILICHDSWRTFCTSHEVPKSSHQLLHCKTNEHIIEKSMFELTPRKCNENVFRKSHPESVRPAQVMRKMFIRSRSLGNANHNLGQEHKKAHNAIKWKSW